MALEDMLNLEEKLQVADIGAAYIAEVPPYKPLLDLGLGHLNAFDADERQHQKLKEVYGDTISLYSDILGDGEIQTLHLASPASGMTSLLKPSEEHLAFFNGFTRFGEILETQDVNTNKLDDVECLPCLDFLKMDIQGSELQVLNSGKRILKDCVAIHLEVSFVPLYQDQPCFGEIDTWMRSQGYLPHAFIDIKRWSIYPTIRNGNFRVPFNQLLEADILYIKDPLNLQSLSNESIKKLALIAHYSYRSPDLVVYLLKWLQEIESVESNCYQQYLSIL